MATRHADRPIPSPLLPAKPAALKDITLIAEFIDVGELGLVLEQMADVLSEDELPITADDREDMLGLVARMQIGGRVPRALLLCPTR